MTQTTEKAFETYVMQMLTAKGWRLGRVSSWDKELALFPDQVTAFIAETQHELWADMRALHADQLEAMLVKALVKELAIKGSLHVLRHGFKFYGKIFRIAYFNSAHGLNAEMLARYARNVLRVTRQVPCHPGDQRTMDLVFAINGLPVATLRAEESRHRADLAQCDPAVSKRSRFPRAAVRIQAKSPGAFCR
jgi:type I restriction enzyme R subunit